MYCPNCGTQSQPNARFCMKCGTVLGPQAAAGGQQPAQQPPYQQPAQQPVQQPVPPPPYQQPAQQPYQQPVQQPVQQPAPSQPYQQPVQQPVQQPAPPQPYQQPAQQPYQQPAQQPPFQQPVPQQPYQQPPAQPYQQPGPQPYQQPAQPAYQPPVQLNQPLSRQPAPGQPAAGAAAGSGAAGVFPSYGRRAVAFLFDMLIVSVVVVLFAVATIAPVVLILSGEGDQVPALEKVLAVIVGLISVAFLVWYPVILPRRTGQTLGKRLMHTKIIDWKTRAVPGMGAIAVRFYIGYPLSAIILGIGFLVPLWDVQKQALHDKLVNTNVIDA